MSSNIIASRLSLKAPRETVSIPLSDLRVGHVMQTTNQDRFLVMRLPFVEDDGRIVLKVLDLYEPDVGPELLSMRPMVDHVTVLADHMHANLPDWAVVGDDEIV